MSLRMNFCLIGGADVRMNEVPDAVGGAVLQGAALVAAGPAPAAGGMSA
jgi:hypothetical protein